MNFFDHENLGNHLLQLCPKVVKHPVCQYPVGPATGHLGTRFLGFPVSVYKRMLGWFPVTQVATACF